MARTWDLNVFLIEGHVKSATDAIAPDKTGVEHRSIKTGLGFSGSLHFKLGKEHPPAWEKLVSSHLNGKTDFFPDSQSLSAVLFIKTKKSLYAYTFGVGGRSLLRRDACVPDFGKKVVLSIVDPQKLRSMDLRTMRDQPFLTRQYAARGARLRSFGVDTLQDHLRAVTGEPLASHAGLATRVTGADSLAYRSKIEFTDLGDRSDSFLAEYKSNAYQAVPDFKWVDQITFVRSQQLIDKLDARALTSVKKGAFDLTPPDMIDWTAAPSFAFADDTAEEERLTFVSFAELLAHCGPTGIKTLTIDQMKSIAIYCFYENETKHAERWTAYDCIELDVIYKGSQYTLAGGRWSLVEPQFLQTVNDYVAEMRTNGPTLPAAVLHLDGNSKGDRIDEAKYITRICNGQTDYAKIHQCGQQVRFGGNEVELCDVYGVKRDLFHFKVWSGSQTFSALAMQGANASEFLTDRQFVTDSRAMILHVAPGFTDALPDDFQPRDYRIVFALIRKEAGIIPFFSRLTLMRAAQRVKSHFFRAAYVQIPVQ